MAGEYVQASNISTYWKELKAFYTVKSPTFKDITKAEYEGFQRSEREDSDNHFNQQRLGEDTQVVDIAFYKYLPDNQVAYRIHIIDINGQQEDHFFIIQSFS